MSMYFREHGAIDVRVFDGPQDNRTKQTFKNETDINKILGRFKKTGVISHLSKYKASYGDFADFDFLENKNLLAHGEQVFAALPGEVRREFDQDPSRFFEFVNDPKNVDRLGDLLPGIAEKGDYFVDVSSRTPPGTLVQDGVPRGRRADDVASKSDKDVGQGVDE